MKTLSLVMIVKNESKVIERCFDSVKDYIDYWVICDTGSTDGTQEFIQSYFKKHKIPGILYNHTWENFGHNRSLAVQAAKGTSDFLLLMDADFIFVPKDVGFKKTLDTNIDAYHVGYEGPLDFKQLLLVRGNIDWYYKGVTHEYITNELFEKREKLISTKTCTFFTFDHKADGGSRSDKFERDIRLLKEALEKEPDNVRYMFYLAQSYRDTQQFEEAIEWYSKRIEKGGWPEEVYFSMYQRGLCKVFCNREFEEYAKDLWEAYQYRPSRLEALYILLVECRKKNKFDLGYKYGIGAINTPYPKKDYLFVQSPVYKYHIWNEIAFHCSKMDKPHISIQLYNRIHEQKNVPEKDTQQFANNYTLFVKQYRELQEKEKEKEQKVGIIIVNRNETEQTDTLIQYLQKNIQIACDVILIDNGSIVKSSFTTISLQSSINKRNALLMGIEYLQTLEVLHNRRYTTIGFMEPSCVFQNNTDCIQEIQNILYKDTTLVGVHPFVLGTTEYPFIHTSYTKHQVSYIPSICCFYKADWLYNNLFSKANVEEGFEIELGYKARDKKIIVDHTYQVECSYALHEPTHYFINTYGKDYTEKLYTNISSNYEKEEKRNVEMFIEKKKQNNIDGYYINLDERKDKKEYIEKNIQNIPFFSKTKRFSAIKKQKGYIGCALSHIEVLTRLLSIEKEYFIVYEDDFQIINNTYFNNFLKDFENIKNNSDWDIITLTPFFKKNSTSKNTMESYNFVKLQSCQTTSCYIIKKSFVPVLLDNFKESLQNLENNKPYTIFSIDQYWKKLFGIYNFYCYKNNFGSQKAGFSNIENKYVDYSIYLDKIKLCYYIACIGEPNFFKKLKYCTSNLKKIYENIKTSFDIIVNIYSDKNEHLIEIQKLQSLPYINNIYIHNKKGVLTELFLTNPYNDLLQNYDYVLFILDDITIINIDIHEMIDIKNRYNIELLSPKVLDSSHAFMRNYNNGLSYNNFLEVYFLLGTPKDIYTFFSKNTIENKWMWGVDFLFGYYNIKTAVLFDYVVKHMLPTMSNKKECMDCMIQYLQKTPFSSLQEIRKKYKSIIEYKENIYE